MTGDVSHTVRVVVSARNADGTASAASDPSDVIGSANGPSSSVKPAVSGAEQVGEQLTVSNGSWTPPARSFRYQWQRCAADGTGCGNVAGATGQAYGIRSADVGHRLRALVTAHTTGGSTTIASSSSSVVRSNTTTNVVTATVQGNKPPTLVFLSLRRIGARVYARFRVCDDAPGRLTVVERDLKSRALSATRRFSVTPSLSCGTYSRGWLPARRFRGKGRYVVTLRAHDRAHALSRLASRSLVRR